MEDVEVTYSAPLLGSGVQLCRPARLSRLLNSAQMFLVREN